MAGVPPAKPESLQPTRPPLQKALTDSIKSFFGGTDQPHGRGVVRGGTVGTGVAVGADVAVAVALGVATCACAPVKKPTKPTRTHTLMTASLEHIRMPATECRS